jgi:hypothetical protein
MEISLVHPAALRSIWDKVKEGLVQMPPEDWIPEDVYWHIKAGQAALYVATEGDAFGGFLVLQRRETEFTGLSILHVWLAYNAGDRDVFQAGEATIRQVAAQMGAGRITFGSPRLGWSRRYPLLTATYVLPPP